MVHYCAAKKPDWAAVRAKYNRAYFEEAAARDHGDTLYVDVRWVVLFRNAEERVSVERIRDCHRTLNLLFSAQNTEELAKVPNTALSPFRPLIGNPNIQFLPLNANEVNPVYVSITQELSGTTPVDDAVRIAGRVSGVLNLYLGTSQSGSILGQAELNSNVAFNYHGTIGGYRVPGTLTHYDLGKTVAHEVAHALGLLHTFSDDVCDGFGAFADTEEAVRPNYEVDLVETSPGVWEQTHDNRWKDRNLGTQLSCLDQEADRATASHEMGINLMDYGRDRVSIMFTTSQAVMMREYLQSAQNTSLELKSADATSINASIDSNAVLVGHEEGEESAQTATLGVAVIAIVAVVGLLALAGLALAYRHFHTPSKDPTISETRPKPTKTTKPTSKPKPKPGPKKLPEVAYVPRKSSVAYDFGPGLGVGFE